MKALRSTLAALHTLAGWAAYDSRLDDHARQHYWRALELAGMASDTYRMLSALQHAAILDREQGAPNDALKLTQLAQLPLQDAQEPALTTNHDLWLDVRTARAFVLLARPDDARQAWARAVAGRGKLSDAFDRADFDHLWALIEMDLGNPDFAAQLAAGSVRTWGPDDRREHSYALITLATIHARTGQPDSARLTIQALDAVQSLPGSARARERLTPLADALSSRDSTCQDLAHHIRQLQPS